MIVWDVSDSQFGSTLVFPQLSKTTVPPVLNEVPSIRCFMILYAYTVRIFAYEFIKLGFSRGKRLPENLY